MLKGRIGRYTDEFYPAATGDNFQRMGYSTILVESGHFPGDYQRIQTRRYTFLALISGLYHIAGDLKKDFKTYFEIPDNEKRYLDRRIWQRSRNARKVVASNRVNMSTLVRYVLYSDKHNHKNNHQTQFFFHAILLRLFLLV